MTDEPTSTGQAAGDQLLSPAQPPNTAVATPPTIAPDPDAKVDQASIDALLNQAQAALSAMDEPAPLPPGVKPFEFKSFAGSGAANEAAPLDLLRDVQLDLKIELGRTHMQLEDVLRLKQGSVVTLDKLAGDPVDVYANGRLIARGEVLVLNDNFCVRVAELISDESNTP
jgi:flagellar motor switch protein FliN/FliY